MTQLKRFFNYCQKEFRRQPVIYILLFILILAGAFFRLYKIEATLMFQGDQGRDAIIVARMFKELDLAFIGPVTSIGNMYLGPFYYYFMLPWLWLSYPNPVGPAIGVALTNIIGIALFYFLGRKMVGRKAALWGAFFFAFSQVAIIYARFSWNPNLTAVFSLLTLYFLHQALAIKTKNWLWVGLSAGLLIQLHYVNLVILAVCGIFWLKEAWQKRGEKKWRQENHFWRYSLAALGIFFLTATPLLLFDWKYDWRNSQAALNIFTKEESFNTAEKLDFPQKYRAFNYQLQSRTRQIIGDLTLPSFPQNQAFFVFSFLILLSFIYFTYKKRHSQFSLGYQILAFSLLLSILVTSLYRHNVYDHYLLFVLPITFLIFGSLLANLSQYRFSRLIYLTVIIVYLSANYSPNFYRSLNFTEQINRLTDFILAHVDEDKKFAFSFHNDNNDSLGEHYRYYLESKTDQFLPVEKFSEAETMFIVDETGKANIYDLSSFDVVVFRQEATVSALLYNDQLKVYQLDKLYQEGNYE